MNEMDELRDLMAETARGMAKMQAAPGNWAGWIIYLLEALDDTARQNELVNEFEFTLAGLEDALSTRLTTGRW
jgi:hypothetical protein